MTKKLSSERLKKDTDPSIRGRWGEENRGFQDETASPLPDLLIDLHGLGCTYNVGKDRVTLLHNEVVEERKEGHVISKKKVKEKEALELLMLGKEEETTFTWVKTNLHIWRANISIAF